MPSGFAIGGLSGGEAKEEFWNMVHVSTDALPRDIRVGPIPGVGVVGVGFFAKLA